MGLKQYFKSKPKEPATESRTIFVLDEIPEGYSGEETGNEFCDNTIQTSKYTLWNFVPKNLFEQFRRIANFYFLCLTIIHFSINSPVSPVTTLLPLLFVIFVTGAKQGFEDWKRHKEDNKVNDAKTHILHEQNFDCADEAFLNLIPQATARKQIHVGDIVKVLDDEEFPCDLLLLSSSNEEGKCDVTTANLDGETNLKTFFCPSSTKHFQSSEDYNNFRAVVECQHPHANLYDFKGRMDVYEGSRDIQVASLGTDNLLLRGARLKNTQYVYGCAIYTGQDTKMALNSKMTASKFSTAERTTNYFLLAYLAVLVFEVTLCMILKYDVFDRSAIESMWYLGDIDLAQTATFKQILQDSFSFFILFSYIIPISLYVTLEMQKFMSSYFFPWDEQMAADGEPAVCNTSDLNEELGQVQYLFTDKTGTLTENSMHFRQCSIGGVKFLEQDGQLQSIDDQSIMPIPGDILARIEFFLLTLALCHTVRVTQTYTLDQSSDNEEIPEIPLGDATKTFLASSPDEKALVEACERLGVSFEGEQDGELVIEAQGVRKRYKRLEVLEFDSDRKLMSVVVEDLSRDKIWLLTKGAESSVLQRCHFEGRNDQVLHEMTLKHIDDCAKLGLRTLAVAMKDLTQEEVLDLSKQMISAKEVITGREEAVRRVMDEAEKDLMLLGATGVEDLLQEGVPETLESLSLAGIKVWVLTGDKIETAVNIANLCGLFKRFMSIIYLTHLTDEENATTILDHSEKDLDQGEDSKNFGLVVDGASLILLMELFKDEFFRVCSRCSAVVCCRMSPKQKAEIVKLVKNSSPKRTVCAAIGDGANDVSMIQEAHIGIGIMGKEGRQAVRCSDFAFAKFRFLKRALLVHGHWYYTRICMVILYCFYKNVAFITPQVFFTFQSAFSTETIYEGAALTMINVTFTALPIIIYGLQEQVYTENQLLAKPELYKENADNRKLSWRIFIMWGLLGFWHAFVTYYSLVETTKDSTAGVPGGETAGYFLFGMVLTTQIVIVCNIKLLVESKYYTLPFVGSFLITLFGYYLFYFVYSGAFQTMGIFWAFYVMHKTACYYFAFFLVLVLCFLPDILIQVIRNSKNLPFIDSPFLIKLMKRTV